MVTEGNRMPKSRIYAFQAGKESPDKLGTTSSSLTAAKFKTKQARIFARLTMSYSPNNDASDQFHDRLRKVFRNNRRPKVLAILKGDMNSMIECCNLDYEEVMARID